MSSFRDIATSFSTMSMQMQKNVKLALYNQAAMLVGDFQQRSPVDTGEYRNRWRIARDRFASSSVASVSIVNSTSYAEYMEYGAKQGAEPWYFPAPKRKRTGKLAVREGRVWAGGLSPGHSKTVGGAIGKGLLDNKRRMNQLVGSIADAVIGAWR